MRPERPCDYIERWLKDQLAESGFHGFIVGISRGFYSAVTATLCSRTGASTHCLSRSIHQAEDQ